MLKILDKLISKSFIGPSLLSFFVALFVLVMQFLWKYIDEILGKGFTIFDLMELIFYFSVTLIPMALPITILISSVMVYGDMAEKYEISSFKSAGVSMLRLLMPGLSIAILIASFSFLSSNLLKPNANFQFQKRLTQLRNQKTALAFEEGIFNNSFDDVLIRINKIDPDGKGIHDIIIFDHTSNDKSLVNIVKAKDGLMYTGGDGKYFVMELDSGMQYVELENQSGYQTNQSQKSPFLRTEFKKWEKIFDMSQFDLDDGFTQFNRKREELLNSWQLKHSVDSFNLEIKKNQSTVFEEINKKLIIETITTGKKPGASNRSLPNSSESNEVQPDSSLETKNKDYVSSVQREITAKNDILNIKDKKLKTRIRVTRDSLQQDFGPKQIIRQRPIANGEKIWLSVPPGAQGDVLTRAISNLNNNRDRWISYGFAMNDYKKTKEKYLLHLHQHFSWAVICILFLLIGAPMGSIIRKGGYGYPFLVAVLFYMVFIISTIFSTKLVRTDSMGGVMAAWLPCMVQAPFGILFTIMALKDIQVKGVFSNFLYIKTILRYVRLKRQQT